MKLESLKSITDRFSHKKTHAEEYTESKETLAIWQRIFSNEV